MNLHAKSALARHRMRRIECRVIILRPRIFDEGVDVLVGTARQAMNTRNAINVRGSAVRFAPDLAFQR
jgi:hypothetical protein